MTQDSWDTWRPPAQANNSTGRTCSKLRLPKQRPYLGLLQVTKETQFLRTQDEQGMAPSVQAPGSSSHSVNVFLWEREHPSSHILTGTRGSLHSRDWWWGQVSTLYEKVPSHPVNSFCMSHPQRGNRTMTEAKGKLDMKFTLALRSNKMTNKCALTSKWLFEKFLNASNYIIY